MATRFYLPNGSSAAVTVSSTTGWDSTGGKITPDQACSKDKLGTALTTDSLVSLSSNNQKVLSRQFVSKPIAAQTVTGTIKAYIMGKQSNAKGKVFRALMRAIVVSNDGSTVRGTLLAADQYAVDSEWPTGSPTVRCFADGDTVSDVTASAGDRIVFQFGFTDDGSGNTSKCSAALRFGDDNASDLPESVDDATDANPWVELSMDVVFQNETRTRFING